MSMASIFTWEHDTPRVASPWLHGTGGNAGLTTTLPGSSELSSLDASSLKSAAAPPHWKKPSRLQAEPQEGPIEYKLHLLLRPRRKFRSMSTGSHVSGSTLPTSGPDMSSRSTSESALHAGQGPMPSAALTQQTRQHRLEQLTTQLLWRLQQSSPHHTSSASNIILPSLPEALPELQAPLQLSRLLHGLEESQGALYEIGVSDDGTLVGLAEDELLESLQNLQAMAACLGCTVEVLRREVVGDCEWIEEFNAGGKKRQIRRTGGLYVAEAFIKPYLRTNSPSLPPRGTSSNREAPSIASKGAGLPNTATEQLRITFAGPTMSGKSTMLGTLTTSILDSGRGKSRLSMLKHRHEITSGITSSVTQELLGYQDLASGDVEVVNYATDNVASWIDIHAAAADSRLVFISDSAGHPRYGRTTVRSLVGWAPHWTLMCIPADDNEESGGSNASAPISRQTLGAVAADVDLAGAQLDLCLRLDLPLVVVITKLDLASRSSLKETLSRLLDALKAAGRKPAIFPNVPGAVSEGDLGAVSGALVDKACNAIVPLLNDPVKTVPIILTSAVQGTGISNLHALLHELPVPSLPHTQGRVKQAVFHIEDVYSKRDEVSAVVVSGHLRSGEVAVDDELMLGPFSIHDQFEDSEDSDEKPNRRFDPQPPASRSFPGALRNLSLSSPRFQLPGQEWRRVKVTSIRNLRLPVHSLLADQVGTIAVAPCDEASPAIAAPSASFARVRKGMVLTPLQPVATRTLVAEFAREDLDSLSVGNHVVIYTASIRASAKVVSARAPDSPKDDGPDATAPGHLAAHQQGPFDFDEDRGDDRDHGLPRERVAGAITARRLQVTFSFVSSREFVVVDDKVLVMPGGGPGLYGGQERGRKGVAGLNGFVGRVVEVAVHK